MYIIDELAEQAGGYFAMPFQDDMAYTDLLFDICQQFGIRYYSATPKVKAFVEEVTRVTWAKEQESLTGIKQDIRPAFSAYSLIYTIKNGFCGINAHRTHFFLALKIDKSSG